MSAVHAIKYFGEVRNMCGSKLLGKNNIIFLSCSAAKCNVRSFRTALKRFQWSSGPRSKPQIETVPTPFEGINVETGGVKLSRLWKPLGFTVAFSTASFAGAAIWQYENKRARLEDLVKSPGSWIQEKYTRVRKQGHLRQQLNTWWNSLTEGQRLFYPICFANCLVFLAWRVPQFQGTMVRYFCSNPASKALCWPMVLSTFSHYSAFHLLANMYVLHSFSSGAVMTLGKEQFLGLYLSAGVVSSMTSYLYKAVTHQAGLSLGASGAIMAVLGYVCTQWPDGRLNIIFLPFISFTAGSAIKAVMALDAVGMLLRWKLFDHAAHLGGALCGIAWCYWGNSYIWQKRKPFVELWHDIRSSPVK